MGEKQQKMEKVICRHQQGCSIHALKAALKVLVASYTAATSLSLLRVLFKKKKNNLIVEIYNAFKKEWNLRVACFTSSFVFTIKSLNCLLRSLRGVDDGKNAIIAGGIAGLSLLTMSPGGLRTDFSLYVWSRAIDVLFRVYTGTLPGKMKIHYAWEVLFFMLSQAAITHASVLEPHNLKPSFYTWIAFLAGDSVVKYSQKISKSVCNNENYHFPTKSFNPFFGPKEENKLSETEEKQTINVPPKIKVDCTEFHSSCIEASIIAFRDAFIKTIKVYVPLYGVPRLVFGLLSARKSKKYGDTLVNVFKSTLIDSVRSSTFLGVYCTILAGSICFFRSFSDYDKRIHFILSGFVSGSSLVIDKAKRYSELNLYCLSRVFEVMYNVLVEHFAGTKMKFHETPALDVAVFCWSCSILFWAHQFKPELIRNPFRMGMNSLLGAT
eukprot:c14476_g1_i2.p1 GENE.c14476_g1_i2~~c14476_g1_i2.p1  ORF type:complete len:438 (-),score=119.47 c14476_g1_i2:81-1394(-)